MITLELVIRWNAPTLRTTRNESPFGHDSVGCPRGRGAAPTGRAANPAADCRPQGALLPLMNVLPAPLLSQSPGFPEVGEDLRV